MKNKVIKLLAKWGNSEKVISEMMEKSFEYAVATYPDSKPSFIADVVSALR